MATSGAVSGLLDPAANPYAPGAGLRPPFLAGRGAALAAVARSQERAATGYADRGLLFEGVRGVGKTVLLLAARDQARAAGGLAVHVQGRAATGTVDRILGELEFELRRARRTLARLESALTALATLGVTVGGVGLTAGRRQPRDALGDPVARLLGALRAVHDAAPEVVVVLTVDEVQEFHPADLSALLVALQQAAGEGLAVVAVAAGLPGAMARAAAVESFAERMFAVTVLGPLSDADSRAALTEPAEAAGGVTWSARALNRVLAAARGYPFYLQHFASAIWDSATAVPISGADADLGIERAEVDLADSLVRARMTNLAPRERRYVLALAGLGPGVHSSRAVATAMGETTNAVASARQRLIVAGLVHAPRRGEVAFTLPMFERLVLRTDRTV